MSDKLLFSGTEWTIPTIEKAWEVIKQIGTERYGLDIYDVNIEVITHDHMLQLMTTAGRGNMYSHWSYGKAYEEYKRAWEKGHASMPYELFSSGDPCFCYIVEGNTAAMQTLVLAHAAIGHNNFDKDNFMFKEWINARAVGPRLSHARNFVKECERKHGAAAVESVLDACHALSMNGIDRFKRERTPGKKKIKDKISNRLKLIEDTELVRGTNINSDLSVDGEKLGAWPFPEENILYFIEKNSPVLPEWKKEIIRIVRTQSQFLYPRIETKLINEGWASFWHFTLTEDLFKEGYIDVGTYMEILHSHTSVAHEHEMSFQHNPYALGYEMWKDIRRACENPTAEDYEYLPFAAGRPWLETLKWIRDNFKDTTFIMDFLGPNVIRKFQMFSVHLDADKEYMEVTATADKDNVYRIREALAAQYGYDAYFPTIVISDYAKNSDRTLYLTYTPVNNVKLDTDTVPQMLKYVQKLWGLPVEFKIIDSDTNTKYTVGKRRY